MVWITVHGVHLLSDAMMDDVFARLTESWRMLLRAIVPAESLAYFEHFLSRTAAEFGTANVADFSAKRQAVIDSTSTATG